MVEISVNYYGKLLSYEKMENFVKNPPKDSSYDLIITEIIKRKQDKCLTL